jgi:phosphoenolpyruvate-protein kinase (PTS system EI component)
MAGDLQAIPLLLGLGVDELSMSPAQIPSAKQVIRQWSLAEAQRLAGQALDLDSAEAVRKTVRHFSTSK